MKLITRNNTIIDLDDVKTTDEMSVEELANLALKLDCYVNDLLSIIDERVEKDN